MQSLITDFLDYLELEKNVSPLTIRNYHHYLQRFGEFSKNINPSKIDLRLVRKYRLYLSQFIDPLNGQPLKRITQNYFLIALRAFLRYLAQIDVQTLTPDKIELGSQDTAPLKILDENSLNRLLEAPDTTKRDGLRDKAILELLFSTGLLVSELASLNRDQLNLKKQEFGIIGKGGKERSISLSSKAAAWLSRFLATRLDNFQPLFIRYQGQEDSADQGEKMRLTTRSIERVVEKYVKKLGLGIKATPHTLRHSFATNLLAKGADIRSVSTMLGHANTSTIQIYTHITNKNLKK